VDTVKIRAKVGTFPLDVVEARGSDRPDYMMIRSETDPRILEWTEVHLDLVKIIGERETDRVYYFSL
jgi:hypothetical protein